MNKIIKMTKMQLEAAFGLSSMLYDIKTDKKKLRKPLLAVVVICLMLPAYYLLFSLVKLLYSAFAALGTPESVLAIGVVSTAGITFVFGLMYTFGSLFASRDLDMLLAMPVKPGQIVASKLLYCIIVEYLFAVPIMLPFVYFYASMYASGVIMILYAIIMTLFLPVIPIALTAIIEILLIRLFGMKISAEKVQSVFMFVGLLFALGINFLSQSASRNNTGELVQLLTDKAAMFSKISSAYFPSKFYARAISSSTNFSGLISFLAFVAISAAIFLLAVFVANKMYMSAVTSGNITQAVSFKKIDAKAGDAMMKPVNKTISIFKYDMKIMLRTSVFMFNTIFIIPLMPVIFAFSFLSQGAEMVEKLRLLTASIGDISGVFYIAIILFMCGITATTSTTFSREGRGFWIQQVIPVSPREQLVGRCLSSVLINSCLYIFCVVPIAIIVKWSALFTIALILTGTIFTGILSVSGLIIDIIRPKLEWDEPAAAVKQNLNSIFNFFIGIILAGIFAAMTYFMHTLSVSVPLILLSQAAISLIVTFLLSKIFIKQAKKHIAFDK